jgi:hypothetical protein
MQEFQRGSNKMSKISNIAKPETSSLIYSRLYIK